MNHYVLGLIFLSTGLIPGFMAPLEFVTKSHHLRAEKELNQERKQITSNFTRVSLNKTIGKEQVKTTISLENPKNWRNSNLNKSLFENARKKDNEINERALILIDSKHKINHKNIQSAKQQLYRNDYVKSNDNDERSNSYDVDNYKTFISNEHPLEPQVFEVDPQKFDFSDDTDGVFGNIDKHPLYSATDPKYKALQINNGMSSVLKNLEHEVKAANRVIGHQYQEIQKQTTLASKPNENNNLASEHREYIELMKPPFLRPIGKQKDDQMESNSILNDKIKHIKGIQAHHNYITPRPVTIQNSNLMSNKLQDTEFLHNFDINKKNRFYQTNFNKDVDVNQFQSKYKGFNPSNYKNNEINKLKHPLNYQNQRNHFDDTDDFMIYEQQSVFNELYSNTNQNKNLNDNFKKASHHSFEDSKQLIDLNNEFILKQIDFNNDQLNKNMKHIESKVENNVQQTKLKDNHIPITDFKSTSVNMLHKTDTDNNNQMRKNIQHSEYNNNNKHPANLRNNYHDNDLAEKLEEITLDTELHTNEGLSISTDSDNIKTDRYVYLKKGSNQKVSDKQEIESKLLVNCMYPECITAGDLSSVNLCKCEGKEMPFISISKSGEIPAIPSVLLSPTPNSEESEISK